MSGKFTMRRMASFAAGSGRMSVGDGASAGNENSCVQAPVLGSSTEYCRLVHSNTLSPTHAIACAQQTPRSAVKPTLTVQDRMVAIYENRFRCWVAKSQETGC